MRKSQRVYTFEKKEGDYNDVLSLMTEERLIAMGVGKVTKKLIYKPPPTKETDRVLHSPSIRHRSNIFQKFKTKEESKNSSIPLTYSDVGWCYIAIMAKKIEKEEQFIDKKDNNSRMEMEANERRLDNNADEKNETDEKMKDKISDMEKKTGIVGGGIESAKNESVGQGIYSAKLSRNEEIKKDTMSKPLDRYVEKYVENDDGPPEGWIEKTSRNQPERVYYVNPVTKEKRWKDIRYRKKSPRKKNIMVDSDFVDNVSVLTWESPLPRNAKKKHRKKDHLHEKIS
jgi:hypothetical protein